MGKAKFYIMFLWLCLLTQGVGAQGLQEADALFAQYKSLSSNGTKENAETYDLILSSYKGYAGVVKQLEPATSEYVRVKSTLLEIFPKLCEAAYFYADLQNHEKALGFAQAYIELSLLNVMNSEALFARREYPMLAYFAAMNTYFKKDYETSILYFQSYLTTKDDQNRESAFENLTRVYYDLKRFDDVKFIAEKTLQRYPNNWNVASMGVDASTITRDDIRLPFFLEHALAIEPNKIELHVIQAQLREREKRYAEAYKMYEEIGKSMPDNADVYCHLAFNAYNAGTQLLDNVKGKKSKKEVAEAKQKAKEYFSKGVPYFKDILNNDPYAYNIAHALAMCYNVMGESTNLRQANQTLVSLRGKAVQPGDAPKLVASYKPSRNVNPVEMEAGSVESTSDIDQDIPMLGIKNANTYVVAIGNEKYKHKSQVSFAHNDANSIQEYCCQMFGVPRQNVHLRKDATLSEIKEEVRFLKEITKNSPDTYDIIFYYAGHGIPNTETGGAYLLPTDATGTDFESCYSLDKLYSEFDEMQAKRVVVLLDACFSGATRTGDMLEDARFVEYDAEEGDIKGHTIVFSAAQGTQTALPYDDNQHGFFTYFLLKHLRESKGNISFERLGKLVTKDVAKSALTFKNKKQEPKLRSSDESDPSWKEELLFNVNE